MRSPENPTYLRTQRSRSNSGLSASRLWLLTFGSVDDAGAERRPQEAAQVAAQRAWSSMLAKLITTHDPRHSQRPRPHHPAAREIQVPAGQGYTGALRMSGSVRNGRAGGATVTPKVRS